MHGTNSSVQRELNRSVIMRLLLTEGPMTRQELVRRTDLTSGAITNIVKDLTEEGIICKSSHKVKPITSPGRPGVLLELNPACKLAVGVISFGGRFWVALYDLSGKALYTESVKTNVPRPEHLVRFLREHIKRIKAMTPNWRERLAGVCVSIPGLVDYDRGIIKVSPRLNWRHVQLRSILEEDFELPCTVENSMRAWTAGEIWSNLQEGDQTFACVYAGVGIGAGLVVNGKLLKGKVFGAGELGHMVLDIDGPRCSCGGRGCLEALASLTVFINKILQKLGKQPLEGEYDEDKPSHYEIYEDIKKLIEARDQRIMGVVDQTAKYLGVAISNLANMIDPDFIIITGPLFETSYMVKLVSEHANKAKFNGPEDSLDIREVPTNAQRWLRGAAAVLFKQSFDEGIHKYR